MVNSVIKEGDILAVWFSCGAASAKALQETIAVYGKTNKIIAVNNPILEEDEDNRRFMSDVSNWLDIEIFTAINPKYPKCSCVEVWDDFNFMSNEKGARCTLELKQKARLHWEVVNRPDWTIMGFTKEELNRQSRLLEKRPSVHILKNVSKHQCFMSLMDAGLKLPKPYFLGLPNANCKGCVKVSSPTYWNRIRVVYPNEFEERCVQSRSIGVKLVEVKGKRIYLDELKPHTIGGNLKDLNYECGLFCRL